MRGQNCGGVRVLGALYAHAAEWKEKQEA